jgi:tetratricopeptide (TPR) repeat protein
MECLMLFHRYFCAISIIHLLAIALAQAVPSFSLEEDNELSKTFPFSPWIGMFPSNDSFALSQEISPKCRDLIKEAEKFLEAALYEQSIPLYQQILQTLPQDTYSRQGDNELSWQLLYFKTRLRLAQTYFHMENYKETAALLKDTPIGDPLSSPEFDQIRRNGFYLAALAFRNMAQYEQAEEELGKYLESGERPHLDFYEEVQFELGLIHFLCSKLTLAKNDFEVLSANSQKPRLYSLSRLYLARIDLLQGHYRDAEAILTNLEESLPTDDILRYELSYLRGEAFFQLCDYPKAADYFNQALPKQNPEKFSWYSETLYHLGWSYLKTGDDPLKSQQAQALYFQKAIEAFQKLLTSIPEERVYLALGQCYLTQATRLKDEKAYLQAETYLSKQEVFISREAQSHALLLRAEAASDYGVRDKYYRQLTQEANHDSAFYPKGWYLRGLNDFAEGQNLLSAGQAEEACKAFERAATSLKKAFELLKANEKKLAGLALKYQAQAYDYQNTHEGRLMAFSILEMLINHYHDILLSLESPDEIFYLHGFVAARLANEQDGEKFADIAEQSLQQGAASFPIGKFADASLNLLGALQYRKENYEQAERTFLHLANDYPHSHYAGEAWFWAANCAEKLQKDRDESKQRRQKVFLDYPQSPYVAEAYFTYYTYREYIQGDRAAIKHLQAMTENYSDTPFLIHAYYLIGLDYKRDRKTAEGKWLRKKNLTAAIDIFQEVESIFDSLLERGLIPNEKLEYYTEIRHRATLERALANLTIAEESQGAKRQIYLEYAEELFHQLVQNFGNPQHPLTKYLVQRDPYPPIHEESSFWLAQTYIKGQNDEAAEKTLSEMLDRYHTAKITRGYFLSRVWYEQGMLAMRREDYGVALQCFKHAEDTAKGRVLSTDQKLDLWIQQSFCYKGLNQLDNAILILSKVINDDAISALRLRAMYLRAEIYELQERRELARKQLETTSKKGGEWALKAKEKLKNEYGY